MDVSAVNISSQVLQQLLAASVSQSLEQATDLAALNLALNVGGAPSIEGVGEQIDLLA